MGSLHRSIICVLALVFSACGGKININSATKVGASVGVIDTTAPTVTINQASAGTVGTCTFTSTIEPTNLTRFSYIITFSEPINPLTFTVADIANTGTGGTVDLQWELTNCGDNTNFKLTAVDVEGNGTIVPVVSGGGVIDTSSNINLASTSTDNSILFLREWFQEAYIKAPNAEASDAFGSSLALDGDTLAVVASGEDSNETTITNGVGGSSNNAISSSAAVYIFKRSGSNWIQEAYIKASNNGSGGSTDDDFGASISLNRDTLAIGAPAEDNAETTITNGSTVSANNGRTNSGAAYVYKRSGSIWAQEAFFKASNADASDSYGSAVSVWGDLLAVGAINEDSMETTITNGTGASADNTHASVGAVYVYRRTGSSWVQEAYIKPSINLSFSYFGSSLSMENDTLVVGAWQGNGFAGEVSIYRRTSGWAEEEVLQAVNAETNTEYGRTVSLSRDTIAVSSANEMSSQNTITNGPTASTDTSSNYTGAVYIYKRSGPNWNQEAYIKASNSQSFDQFSNHLAFEGDTLAVGASNESSNQTTISNGQTASADNSVSSSGAVYVYRRKNNLWIQEAYIKSINAEAMDRFGGAIGLSGDTLAVGASGEDSGQTTITNGASASADNSQSGAGAVYIYRFNGRLFDVTDVWGTTTSNSVTLNWHRTGGLATNYLIAYQIGSMAPSNCSSGSIINAGNVSTRVIALSSGTTYSFRVCATDGTEIASGSTVTLTTL